MFYFYFFYFYFYCLYFVLRYYALAATSALLSYIQDNLYIYYAAGTIKIDYQESEGYALIGTQYSEYFGYFDKKKYPSKLLYNNMYIFY